ncbi:acyl-CoA-binding domain-containing protein 3 [Nymphaea colorata]|nr:acyl-CoA-binding domain-containing protein 3 [Nymphaea colorata]
MEVLQEIFLTAFFSLLFAFLLAKLVSVAADSDKETRKQTTTDDDLPAVVGERLFGRAMETVPATLEGGESRQVAALEFAKEEKEAARFGDVVYEGVRETTETVVVRELPEFGTGGGEGCGLQRVFEGGDAEEEKGGVVALEEEEKRDVLGGHVSELASSPSDVISEEKLAVEEQTKGGQSPPALSAEMMETEDRGDKSVAGELREIGTTDVCKEETAEKQPNVAREFDLESPKEAEEKEGSGKKGEAGESEAHGQGGEISDEEDWEGIERSEVSKQFSVAERFIASPNGNEMLSKLENDVQMQLYGLQKAATEGPCYESSPSALKPGARAKWNAWQKVGSISPEMAMEQYIALLSESIPEWRASVSLGNQDYDGMVAPVLATPDSSSSTGHNTILDAQRKVNVHACNVGGTDSPVLKFTERSSHMDSPEHAVDSSSV